MTPVLSFFLGLGILLGIACAILLFVRQPLRKLLVELCGTEDRAAFWQHLYEIVLLLAVTFSSLLFPPDGSAAVGFFEFLGMFRAGLLALLITIGMLAATMAVSIRRFEERSRRDGRTRAPSVPPLPPS